MLNKSLRKLRSFVPSGKDDRKYFAIVFFILMLFILSGIVTPLLVQKKKDNWNEELSEKISEIRESVTSLYKSKENELSEVKSSLKNDLTKTLSPGNTSYGALIKLVNTPPYNDYSVEIFAPNGRLIAWNKIIAVPQEDLFPLEYPAGEVHFYERDLITYLMVIDTFHIEHDLFYFTFGLPFEKHYFFQNPHYLEFSFTKDISDEFYTRFEVDYNPFIPHSRDGRKYSFEIINNKGNKTGLVTFVKPSLDTTIQSFHADISKVQSLFVVLGFFFIAFAYKKDFKKIKYRLLKLLLLAVYLSVFRMLLYFLNFPGNVIEGTLTDPAYFSSAFAFGIVKSPLEFFITILVALILSLTAFRYIIDFIKSASAEKFRNNVFFLMLFLPAAFMFFITLRGLASAIRSVIFDSTLRYFKVPTLIPDFPSIVMNLNILMLGVAVILILSGYILLLLGALPQKKLIAKKRIYVFLFLVFIPSGILFIYVQNQPLISPLMSSVFVLLLFLLTYHIYFLKINSIFNYIYITLAASLITITLLHYFNLQLEREALKTTALEINRPNDNLLKFLVSETLNNAAKDQVLIDSFNKKNINYNAAAFKTWSHSSLQRESLNSLVMIYNSSLMPVGSFGIGIDEGLNPAHYLSLPTNVEAEVKEIQQDKNSDNRIFAGIIPLVSSTGVKGFAAAAVNLNMNNIISTKFPEFLESKKNILSSVIDINQLKIFEIENGRLSNIYGDIYPSRDQIKPLLDMDIPAGGEAWIKLNINEENFITYVLSTEDNGAGGLTAVALRERQISWNLFNFFKIFVIHSLFILSLFLFLFILSYKKFKYSFRTQLLIGFLIISILPILLLAVYNRFIFSERSESSIFNELNERSLYLENHVRVQMGKYEGRDLATAFENAGRELGISFAVYEGSQLLYNSKNQFYEAGLFNNKLNSLAYYNLSYQSYREYFTKEQVENFTYDALYKRVTINGRNFIIEVNDAFNKVNISFSVVDADVFLFGVYSFAVLIIIILSTLLANKISSPIRRLTKATDSVAHGDLNVYLVNNEKGEIRDLLEGFNMMTKELKKNEAELTELERENAWKEMAKQVAHEIKNPLTPMKLAVQQLVAAYKDRNRQYEKSGNSFDNMFEKLSSTVLNQIENLSQIASEFSRFAKMPNLNLEELDLIPVVNDTVNLFTDEKIKIEVVTRLSKAPVEADYSQLRRMIINFIRNSIQADATIINFSIISEDNFYAIIIEDNGKGIPEPFRNRIFDSNFTTKEKGLGIGLKLAKRFLEGINGKIELINSSDEGTVFKIQIPKIHEVPEAQVQQE